MGLMMGVRKALLCRLRGSSPVSRDASVWGVGVQGGARLTWPGREGVALDETQNVALHPQSLLVVLLREMVLCGLLQPSGVGPSEVPLPGVSHRALLHDALQRWVRGGERARQRGVWHLHMDFSIYHQGVC